MEGGRSLPLSRRDLAAATVVFAIFGVGLAGLYLSMPASDYSFLKLPRTLEDIRILRFEHLFACPCRQDSAFGLKFAASGIVLSEGFFGPFC